jgi:hypothetical protein
MQAFAKRYGITHIKNEE